MSTRARQQPAASTTYEAVVGVVLEKRRKAIEQSQADLALAVGVTQSTWSRIERGLTGLSLSQLRRAADALQTTPSDLLREADQQSAALRRAGVAVGDAPSARDQDGLPIAGAALAGLLVGLALNSKG